MASPERDRLLPHDYDGIEEYDNPLPGWWRWIFYATIVFSVGYWAYYQLGPGPSIHAAYEAEVRAAEAVAARRAPAGGAATDEQLRALAATPAVVARGGELFATRCMPCHGARGEGVIGPNLTDEYWLHGGKPTDILHTVTEGVPDKGMVPWKGQLQADELAAVSAYVVSLAGTRPPKAKPPQGTDATGRPAPAAPVAGR